MATAVWTGTISFGLVSIPVKLYPAVSGKTIHFNQIDTRTGARIRQKRVSAADGSEVPRESLAKGYEMPDGQYVILDDGDLDSVSPKKSSTIEIEQFVNLSEIDPIIYDRPYNVVPDKSVVKPYALLMAAMEEAGQVAVARFVMRAKEHLAAIRPDDGRLVLSTMVFADEVNDPAQFASLAELDGVEVTDRERAAAEQLIASLTEPFDHSAFHDEYRQRVEEMIDRKASGAREVVEGEPAASRGAEVVDLMAALEASVQEARAARGRHPSARATADAGADEAVEEQEPAEATGTDGGTRKRRAPAKKAAKKKAPAKASAPRRTPKARKAS